MILRLLGTVGVEPLLLLQVRAVSMLFKQVSDAPEKYQNYIKDVRLMRRGPLEDEGITFQRAGSRAPAGHPSSPPHRQPAESGPRKPA